MKEGKSRKKMGAGTENNETAVLQYDKKHGTE